MANKNSIWNNLKKDWNIKKHEITSLGIDPNKEWDNIMLFELDRIAEWLEVLVEDII